MTLPRVAILGAGPAGVGAAWQLRRNDKADVILLEQQDDVGGNAGSFELAGMDVDYGSHRLHPACAPHILKDLQSLLGDDLLLRPRHGRIRLRGRWIHFPLKPVDLLRHLPLSFSLGVGRDVVAKLIPRRDSQSTETFETVLQRGLGRTICRDFYFPYARKLWGLHPADLSATQARRRVSAGSLGKLFRKVLMPLVPRWNRKPVGSQRQPATGHFFYPRRGYGQITRAMASETKELGADLQLRSRVKRILLGRPHRIEVDVASHPHATTFEADHIWSTLPIPILARMIEPAAPDFVLESARKTRYRGMILIYWVLNQPQFTPYDAHYFPDEEMPLSRLSEPKNYAARSRPADRTVLCAELPCNVGDEFWNATDRELGDRMMDALGRCDLPIGAQVLEVVTRRLPCAYPVYVRGFEEDFHVLDEWISGLERVLSFGRQGLFAHDNTHHALAMAYAAVDCMERDGTFDRSQWQQYRRQFETHVVED